MTAVIMTTGVLECWIFESLTEKENDREFKFD